MSRPGPVSALREDLRQSARWPSLDGLRGLALVGVVIFHVYRLSVYGGARADVRPSSVWAWPLGAGKFTIDVFFVLSGFLIVRSWRSLTRRHDLFAALRDFWRRRARRVLPAWWASLLVLVPLTAPELLRTENWWRLGALATVQQHLVERLTVQVNIPSWSLTTEIHFYLAVPLVVWLIDRLGGPIMLAGSLAFSIAWWQGLIVESPTSMLPGRLDQFVVGALAASVVAAHDQGIPSRLAAYVRTRGFGLLALVAVVGFSIHEGARFGRPHLLEPVTVLSHPVMGVITAGLLIRWLTSTAPNVLCSPVSRGLGLISYSTYLWHYPLLIFLFYGSGMNGQAADLPLATLGVVVLSLAAVVGVGALSYALFERPFLHQRSAPATAERRSPGKLEPSESRTHVRPTLAASSASN